MFDTVDRQPPPLTEAELADAPDQAAAYLAALQPGGEAVSGLARLDVSVLSRGGRVDALVAIEKQLAWLAGVQQRVLAGMLADPLTPDDPHDALGALERSWLREEVACALRLPAGSAQARLVTAHDLVGRLPATLRLLENGVISARHAEALADAVRGLDDEAAGQVETRALDNAPGQTLPAFRRAVARAVATADARRVEERREHGMARRRMSLRPVGDGMAELWALLPAEGAAAVMSAVTALAAETPCGDERSADQRRADALVDLGVTALHDPLLPKAQGLRPCIQVTVALSTLLGCDEQPGELAGYGPIPAALARRIAADPTGTWRRLVTDPLSGALLDYARSTYRPPADLADFVLARDQTCTFPGCARPAHRCDLDHQAPYDDGGPTAEPNLAALCRRHHRAKHEAGWSVHRDPHTRASNWTSPTGHPYQSEAPELPRDQTTTARPDLPTFLIWRGSASISVHGVTVHVAGLAEVDPATLYRILRLRVDVFVVEQNCPYPELDGRDLEPSTKQLWVERDGEVVATLRLLVDPDGTARIGRVATARDARKDGLAGRLMARALELAGDGEVVLDAQSYLERWYERFGFVRCGAEYVEDGILHVPMRRASGSA